MAGTSTEYFKKLRLLTVRVAQNLAALKADFAALKEVDAQQRECFDAWGAELSRGKSTPKKNLEYGRRLDELAATEEELRGRIAQAKLDGGELYRKVDRMLLRLHYYLLGKEMKAEYSDDPAEGDPKKYAKLLKMKKECKLHAIQVRKMRVVQEGLETGA